MLITSLLITSLALFCTAQGDSFQSLIDSKRSAVSKVAASVERALASNSWCAISKTCNETQCLYHGCSGTFGSTKCETNISVLPCTGGPYVNETHDEKCFSDSVPEGLSINYDSPILRTPEGAISSSGDGEPIVVEDIALRRDLCALKTVASDIASAHKENNVKYWLYAGTTNKAFASYPGTATCRGDSSDPLLDCAYDPTSRPWYITAASGPRRIVFLFDRTALTTRESRLKLALLDVLSYFDVRDKIAVVAYSNTAAKVIPESAESKLKPMDEDFREELSEAILDQVSAGDSPNARAALDLAFNIFRNSSSEPDESGDCPKYIVLLQGKQDQCFINCRSEGLCRCVQEALDLIEEKQAELESPVSIVALTESAESDFDKVGNLERLARVIVCSSKSTGVWKRITESDTNTTAMAPLTQLTALALYQDDPKVFTSGLYEDFAGLGKVFTFAIPVYERDEKRLVAVVGIDIAFDEVKEVVENESQANAEIEDLSQESRLCPEPPDKDGCKFQALRSQYGSICPSRLPPDTCYRFGESVFKRGDQFTTYTEASGICANESGGTISLAIVDTNEKNEFLSGLFDADGTWIGLSAVSVGANLSWEDARPLGDVQFDGFDGSDAVKQVHADTNEGACVTADRRGVRGNWNVVPCAESHQYVCQVGEGEDEVQLACAGDIYEYKPGLSVDEENPQNCTLSVGTSRSCNAEEEEAIKYANPLCNQEGKNYTEIDRTCCSGKAGPLDLKINDDKKEGLGTGPIVGIVIGAVVLAAIIVILIIIVSRSKKNHRQELEPTIDEVEADDLREDDPDDDDGQGNLAPAELRIDFSDPLKEHSLPESRRDQEVEQAHRQDLDPMVEAYDKHML